MSDSRKYLLGATATIVSARIVARAHERSGGDMDKPAPGLSLKDEFIATWNELTDAMAAIEALNPAKPYAEKQRKRENENLLGD